jgi:Arc/MetJ-type ribon-helix-helix transcriptional regulator
MQQISVRLPDDLEADIKKDIGRMAAEDGELKNLSEWMRQAAYEKLARSATQTKNPQSEEGAA